MEFFNGVCFVLLDFYLQGIIVWVGCYEKICFFGDIFIKFFVVKNRVFYY